MIFINWYKHIIIHTLNPKYYDWHVKNFITNRVSKVNFMIMKDLINPSKQEVRPVSWLYEEYFYHNVKFLNIISTSDWIFLSIIKFMQSCNYIFPLKEDLGKVCWCKTIILLDIESNHAYDFFFKIWNWLNRYLPD